MADIKCWWCSGTGKEIYDKESGDDNICRICYGVGTIPIYNKQKKT